MNAYAIAYDNIRAERDQARLEAQRLKEQRDELVAPAKPFLKALKIASYQPIAASPWTAFARSWYSTNYANFYWSWHGQCISLLFMFASCMPRISRHTTCNLQTDCYSKLCRKNSTIALDETKSRVYCASQGGTNEQGSC